MMNKNHTFLYLLVSLAAGISAAGEDAAIIGDYSKLPVNRWVLIHTQDSSGGKAFARLVLADNIDRLYLWGTGGKKPARNVFLRYELESLAPTAPQWLPGFPESMQRKWTEEKFPPFRIHGQTGPDGLKYDEGPTESIQLPPEFFLTARDAFNGTVLWKRPLRNWFNPLYPLKSGPNWLPRRLVAINDRVYIAPGIGQDLLCLYAATGKTVCTYADTASTFELIVSDGITFAAVDTDRKANDYSQQHPDCWRERDRASKIWGWNRDKGTRVLNAIQAKIGNLLWETEMLVAPMMGTPVYDMEKDKWFNNHWIRGGCVYGIMPANDMVYATPNACACYYQVKLNGFNAVASEPQPAEAPPVEERRVKGPAYGKHDKQAQYSASEWPTFRHDNRRSGHVRTDVPAEVEQLWKEDFSTKISQPTIAAGRLFLSAIERHTVYALDATSGREIWPLVADGRVNSSPTIYKGLALFGCADI